MITKEIALSLKFGAELHHATFKDSRGAPLRVRVNGQCKTWKSPSRSSDFRLPVKQGLYMYGYIEPANASDWQIPPTT